MWSPESCVEGESCDDSVDFECLSEDWFCSDDVENAMVDSVWNVELEEAENVVKLHEVPISEILRESFVEHVEYVDRSIETT